MLILKHFLPQQTGKNILGLFNGWKNAKVESEIQTEILILYLLFHPNRMCFFVLFLLKTENFYIWTDVRGHIVLHSDLHKKCWK